MSEITESMLSELDNVTNEYAVSSQNGSSSFGCACGHTCQFRCEGGCWDESAMGF